MTKRSATRKKKSGTRKSKRTKYLITILNGDECVDVCYLGYDFVAARAAIDKAIENPAYRHMTLRMVRSINRKVITIRDRHLY